MNRRRSDSRTASRRKCCGVVISAYSYGQADIAYTPMEVCKTSIHRFESGRRLHKLTFGLGPDSRIDSRAHRFGSFRCCDHRPAELLHRTIH